MMAKTRFKESCIPWVGKIPAHWNEVPLCGLFYDKQIKNSEGIENNVLSLSYGNIIRRNVEDNYGLLPESFNTYQIVNPGDIILRLTDLQNDKRSLRVGLVKEKGIITSAYLCLCPLFSNTQNNPEYFYYLLHSYDIYKIFYNLGGGVRQSMGFKDLKRMHLLIPPKIEQDKIVQYIKTHSDKIDLFIRNKERLIKLLKEQKESVTTEAITKGIYPNVITIPTKIGWLGNIPEHWNTKRLKNIGTYSSGNNITNEIIEDVGDYPVFGGNGLRGYYKEYTHNGDYVLIGRQGALCGNVNYASGKFWASEHAIVVTLNPDNDIFWFGETLRTMNLNQYSQSAAQPGISVERIKMLHLPCPSYDEQKEIANYIKTEAQIINATISKAKREIELIKEYKEAMIAEAVMGKLILPE